MKTLEIDELPERLREILRQVEKKGEIVEVTDKGEVIARVVPAKETKQPIKRDLKAFWTETDQLAAEIGAHWQGDMDAVEAVRDVRKNK